VEEIYAIGDLFLIPSGNESFGLSALEAMACGVPVISSNAGGLPELVLHGETGFACPVGNVDCMAHAALELLTDEVKWKQFSDAAEKHASGFGLDNIVPQYEAYYQEVVNEYSSVI
ncbi:MAG: glycosyltransferase, partial [Bacteroidetes bacterium]|nr:glycosyltransferase [Bacteroidota bacterium]